MKKILLTLMAIFAFGLQNVCAQDAPLKIVTNNPDFTIKVKRCAASGKTVVLDLILNNVGTNDVMLMFIVLQVDIIHQLLAIKKILKHTMMRAICTKEETLR